MILISFFTSVAPTLAKDNVFMYASFIVLVHLLLQNVKLIYRAPLKTDQSAYCCWILWGNVLKYAAQSNKNNSF